MHQVGPSLTIANARATLDAGLKAIGSGETVFELASVKEVDSSAVAALLAWQRAASARGASLSIMNAPASLSTLVRLYGVSDLISV